MTATHFMARDLLAFFLAMVGMSTVGAAALHGYLGETRLIAPATFRDRQARQLVSAIWQFSSVTWAAAGLVIAVSPFLVSSDHLLLVVALACLPLAYGAVFNAVITRGRHFGWRLLTALICAALVGALLLRHLAPLAS